MLPVLTTKQSSWGFFKMYKTVNWYLIDAGWSRFQSYIN
jgi:hypothetical protein